MSINEINPANSLKTGVDSFTGLPGSISDINRELFGQPLSKAPNSVLGGIPMNSLLEADDRSISAIQTKARSGASSVYGNESGIFQIDRAAQQVGQALMDNPITAPVPSGDRVDRAGGYDELLNPNPSNLSATVLSGDTQKELGTGSNRRELQKADGNGFTEREAYQLPGKEVYVVKSGDTLSGIAQAKLGDGNRWRELQKADGKGFTEQEAYKLPIGTEVYLPESDSSSSSAQPPLPQESAAQIRSRNRREVAKEARENPVIVVDDDGNILFDTTTPEAGEQIGRNKEEGDLFRDLWAEYYECLPDIDDIVITEVRWLEENGEVMRFGPLTGKNPKTGKPEKYPALDSWPTRSMRTLDIVRISKDGRMVTGIEVKTTDTEAERIRSRAQEARDNDALTRKGWIRDPNTGKLYQPTKVDRVQGMPPDCDEPDSKKPKRNPPPKPPKIDLPARPPVGNVEPPREPPKTNPPAPPPAGNVEPPEPPKTNLPVRPPATEPPKTNLSVRPPATEPPKINPPVRPPVRPPALSGALNIGSKIARPLGVVTDVIDLKNAYDEDGGFGKNFQETAGGVAGGWGGAAAGAAGGAAIGSLAGPVGTVVGGIAGGIIGGFGGSAAGEGIVKGIRGLFG